MTEKKKWVTKPNSGSAFVNKRKQKDTHPDFTGEMLVLEPGLYWFNMWQKQTQEGDPWFSVALSPKEDRSATASVQVEVKPAQAQQPTVSDDEIPF